MKLGCTPPMACGRDQSVKRRVCGSFCKKRRRRPGNFPRPDSLHRWREPVESTSAIRHPIRECLGLLWVGERPSVFRLQLHKAAVAELHANNRGSHTNPMCLFSGSSRMRWPVAAKMALASAGAAGGTGGSPMPRTSPVVCKRAHLDARRLVQAQALVGMEVGLLRHAVGVGQLGSGSRGPVPRRRRLRPAPRSSPGRCTLPTSQATKTLSMRMPALVAVTSTTSATGTPKDKVKARPRPRLPSVPAASGCAPARHLAHGLQHAARGLVRAQAQPLGQRVGAGGADQLVEETFVQEAVARRTDRAP